MPGPMPQYLEDLIASQKAEIERLRRETDVLGDAIRRRNESIERLTAALTEIEQLAGRGGPPNELDALNEIEAVAKAALRHGVEQQTEDRA